jgi:hypothetical protein
MVAHLFQNGWYRVYFQLVDSFSQPRCPLCALLAQKEQELITALLHGPEQRRTSWISAKTLCVFHKSLLTKAADDSQLLPMLKTAINHYLEQLAHHPKRPPSGWSRWLHRFRGGCSWCGRVLAREQALCRALVRLLDDGDFWKEFQRAPLLCLDHLEKCLCLATNERGFERLLKDQSAKLNELLNDLIRFEATGNDKESRSIALDWLAGFIGPSIYGREITVSSPDNMPREFLAEPQEATGKGHDSEELLFENEKLRRKVEDLIQRLNHLETRAASLHYRVSVLSEDNKRLEMGYTGASTQARGLEKLVRNLRAEVATLKEGNPAQRAKAAS